MGLPSSRFMLFHWLVLLPPLVLLTLTCLYTSSTFRPFSTTRHISFSQDVQCYSCETSSSFPSRLLSIANFQTSSYIRDVGLLKNVLKVEDSRGEAATEPVSRRDTNEVESEHVLDDPHTDTVPEKVRGGVDLSVEDKQTSFGEKPTQPVRRTHADEEVSERDDQATTFHSDEHLAEGRKARSFFSRDNVVDISHLAHKNVQSSIPEEKSVQRLVQALESSTEEGKNLNVDQKDPSPVPREQHAHRSDGQVVEKSEEDGKEAVGSSGHVENKAVSSVDELKNLGGDNHTSADAHLDSQIKETVSVGQPKRTVKVEEVMRFGHENMTDEIRVASIAVQKQMNAITMSGLPTDNRNSPPGEALDVNLLLRGGSPQGVALPEERSCQGRHVFVYDLPSKFNADLVGQCDTLLKWFNFCDYFMNQGMGTNVPTDVLNDREEKVLVPDGSWFLTHQYALEIIFHARLKHYPCLTTDADEADLFFVPYYAGLDVIRWHFQPNVSNDQRDELTMDIMSWLEGQDSWVRNNGTDHVFVLGKIGWDFRRASNSGRWGSKLLRLPSMKFPTKVLIERDPWHSHDVGVPHPTFFHPKDDGEIRTWLTHVEQSERRYLVSFAGMPRPNMLGNVRGHLIQQCLDHPDDCFLLKCVGTICLRPDSTMNLFLHSHFCMQPPGDSPTRRSVFDSLVGGCIPVLFDPYTAYYQYPWHLPQNASSYSVFIPSHDVMAGKSDIVEILKSISPEERTAMRTRIIREIIPGLLYSQPGTKHSDFRDAFDISIEALLHRVAVLRLRKM